MDRASDETPRLWAIVEAHMERYGPTEAVVARKLGMSSSGLARWKGARTDRGRRPALPRPANLQALSELTGVPYAEVIAAAQEWAEETGWAPDPG